MWYAIAGIAGLAALAAIWWTIFGAAMRDPNNGNDLSKSQGPSSRGF